MAESGYNLISRQPKVVLGDAATWRQSEWTLDMEIMGIMTQIKECNKSKYWATKAKEYKNRKFCGWFEKSFMNLYHEWMEVTGTNSGCCRDKVLSVSPGINI